MENTDVAGPDHPYTKQFAYVARSEHYVGYVDTGMGILTAVNDDILAGVLCSPEKSKSFRSTLATLERLCTRFHQVVRQLRSRHSDRSTLSVTDEYDVQDLFRALLYIDFTDVRPEENTPSYAGKASRADFLLKPEGVVVEIKKTRPTLTGKEVGSQLTEDVARYAKHPDCKALVCFVYDPDGYVANARGVESDLNRDEPFPVRVFVRPE